MSGDTGVQIGGNMYSYSIIQWLFFFYFYCFFGWCFESTYVSLKKKKWVNRGFMKGPFLPLYGSGGIMMLVVSKPFLEHWWAVYIAGCIGATILEYVTGVVMEALFKVRYWDYSKVPFNFQGHICLGSSLAWGGLTLFMNYVLHSPIERLVLMIPHGILTVVTLLLTVYIAGDFALAFKAALDFRDVLVQMEKAWNELHRLQKRLDVVIAVADDEWSSRKETWSEDLEQTKEAIAESLGQKKEIVRESLEHGKDSIADALRMEELKGKIENHLHAVKDLSGLRRQIMNNPSMNSVKYKEVLEELKKKLSEKKK